MSKAFGRDPTHLWEVLSPLLTTLAEVEGDTLGNRRQKFLYFQMTDAYRTTVAIMNLVKAFNEGEPVAGDSIEVLARRMVEQAIVTAYVAQAPNDSIIDRYLKTSVAEWKRAWSEAADPELAGIYAKLSYLSHPRGAVPYSLLEFELSLEGPDYFLLRLAKVTDWLDTAVTRIVAAYKRATD